MTLTWNSLPVGTWSIIRLVSTPDEASISRLTNEALPHVAAIRDFLSKWTPDGEIPDAQYLAYCDSVDSFKAIRDRMPVCRVRDAWDEILQTADSVIHIPDYPGE